MLYNSADSSDLSEHFTFYEAYSRILNSQRSSAFNILSLILPCFVFKPHFFQLSWVYFLKIMWKEIFDDLFQPMHCEKNNLFQSSDWGMKGGNNNLLIQSTGGWWFNPTNSVVPCWSLAMSIRKKGCSGVHQLLHHIPECRALAGGHGVRQGKMCKGWNLTASPGGEGTHPGQREALRHGFAWGLPPSQVMRSKTRLLVTLPSCLSSRAWETLLQWHCSWAFLYSWTRILWWRRWLAEKFPHSAFYRTWSNIIPLSLRGMNKYVVAESNRFWPRSHEENVNTGEGKYVQWSGH